MQFYAGWILSLFVTLPAMGQGAAKDVAHPSASKPAHMSLYLAMPVVDFLGVVGPPPAENSAVGRQDLAAMYAAQTQRSPDQVKQAQHDDKEEDIFIFANVLGTRFRAEGLPLTAALSAHIRNEAGTVTPSLKNHFGRPRPFVTHSDIHPVCEQKREPGYPSGHSMIGYLEAFTLAQMLPARSAEILARADEYAHNRVVCGVHYPSDVAASRTAALVEFGALASAAQFHEELARARQEILRVLGGTVELPAVQLEGHTNSFVPGT